MCSYNYLVHFLKKKKKQIQCGITCYVQRNHLPCRNGVFHRLIDNVKLKVAFVNLLLLRSLENYTIYSFLWILFNDVAVVSVWSRALRCGVQEGEGVAEWTCKIDSWTRSERVPEVAGINRRAGASFDLSHAPLPQPPPNWSLYCFCRMSPWLRQDAVNGQPPADNSQLYSLNTPILPHSSHISSDHTCKPHENPSKLKSKTSFYPLIHLENQCAQI